MTATIAAKPTQKAGEAAAHVQAVPTGSAKGQKWAARGRIDFWVRNLVRKPCCSFFLQMANGRFYPDFVCRLPDKTVLVVEYKGANLYAAARVDRDIGDLWAELSGGKCRFVMVTDKKWDAIPL